MKQNKFGGVMIWSLALDDFNGQFCNRGPYPLLTAVNEELGVRPPRASSALSTNLIDPALPMANAVAPADNPLAVLDPSLAAMSAVSADMMMPGNMFAEALAQDTQAMVPMLPSALDQTAPQQSLIPPPILVGNTGNTNQPTLPDIRLPVILSDPGNRAAVSPQAVAPVRHDRSHNSETMLISAPQEFPRLNLSNPLETLPLSLAHDRPPEIVPIQPSAFAETPHLVHHAQLVPDTPVVLPANTQGAEIAPPILMTGDIPHAEALHAGIPAAAPMVPVVAAPVAGQAVAIEQPSSDQSIGIVEDPAIFGSVISSGTNIMGSIPSVGTVAGIPLSAVRPAPASKPGVNISFSSSSNSSSSSSSSKSESKSSSINIGSDNPVVANTLRELLQHHAPVSSSSSSSSSSSTSGGHGGGHDMGHGGHGVGHTDHADHPISVSVVKNPQDINIPPGSRVEAVIPINSIDNLAEVLASLGTSVPSSSRSIIVPDANALNAGQVLRELDLANLLGIDANTLGGAITEAPSMPSFSPAVPREISRSRQVFRSPTIDQQPIARRTTSGTRPPSQQQLLLRQLQQARQRPRTVSRPAVDQRQALANLRARRLALLRARQRAAAQAQQRAVDLNQLSGTQLRRLLNRLDGATLQRLINSGRLTLTPNVEQPRQVTLSGTQVRRITPSARSGQVARARVPRTLRAPTTRTNNNRFTASVIRPQRTGGRRVVFINNNNVPTSSRLARSRDTFDRTILPMLGV